MTSRAAHYRNKARHDQREFGTAKLQSTPRDEGTQWIGEFVSSVQGLSQQLTSGSIICLQLGRTADERVLKLRELSKMGILHMSAYKVNGQFVEYRWQLTPAGVLV